MYAKTATSIYSFASDSGLHAEVPQSSNTCPHGHEWIVFSTALAEVCLMVQCVECGTKGSIDDPSKEEWSEAFDAPSSPYRWIDGARVRVCGIASPRVIRDAVGPRLG